MERCIAICGGRKIVEDFVWGVGGRGQIDPRLAVNIGLN